jgi:hypothetical protein
MAIDGSSHATFWSISSNSVAVVAVASPLAEGERIEVRGFSSAGELKWPTLTLTLSLGKGEANLSRIKSHFGPHRCTI